jgi:hypothetical protein
LNLDAGQRGAEQREEKDQEAGSVVQSEEKSKNETYGRRAV